MRNRKCVCVGAGGIWERNKRENDHHADIRFKKKIGIDCFSVSTRGQCCLFATIKRYLVGVYISLLNVLRMPTKL